VEVCSTMRSALASAATRFASVERLLTRLERHADRALGDLAGFRQFNESHNEACVAIELVSSPHVAMIDYEPPMRTCDKRLDFSVDLQDGRRSWVEVKTVDPADQDDWDKYEAALDEGRFPTNVDLILVKGMMGGEIYHDAYAGRAKLLDYAVETEGRLEACRGDIGTGSCTLVIAANPFKLPMEAVEDFAHFYRTGKHSPWDEFRDMEVYDLERRGVSLTRTIARFAYVGRATFEIWPRVRDWNVHLPTSLVDLA